MTSASYHNHQSGSKVKGRVSSKWSCSDAACPADHDCRHERFQSEPRDMDQPGPNGSKFVIRRGRSPEVERMVPDLVSSLVLSARRPRLIVLLPFVVAVSCSRSGRATGPVQKIHDVVGLLQTGASWLNLVERLFGELTQRQLKELALNSVAELITVVTRYLDHRNATPKPFIWAKSTKEIIAKIERGLQTLEAIH